MWSFTLVNVFPRDKADAVLQRVPRTGWVYRKVKEPESVSDHMYRMAVMSLTITDPAVDKDRWAEFCTEHALIEGCGFD